jgi:hypothetical protein
MSGVFHNKNKVVNQLVSDTQEAFMRLTPTEILHHLGFDIPSEGVEINPNDAYLTISALHLVGDSISTDLIPDDKLVELHLGLSGIVAGWTEQGLIAPIAINEVPSEESLLKLRATLNALLKVTFKQNK